jgi:DNA polymerase III epsilon subunit-like protein
MESNTNWIIVDTETTGFTRPIFAVDIAAQKMKGWDKEGEPFRRIINHGCDISSEASRVHGYTREILERDGELPAKVYEDFSVYVGDLPIVAYNLQYDWNQVLVCEWRRLGIAQIGVPGFCAFKLAQRLLDPVPAGNCKLQTLRQYYRLPENGAHTALGDVLTVVDLIQKVLRPLATNRGLNTWDRIVSFAANRWFPCRIPFGKFKGRMYQEAKESAELLEWLRWLAASANKESSLMGRWYLDQLETASMPNDVFIDVDIDSSDFRTTKVVGMMVYLDPEAELYKRLIEAARHRLVELEIEYGILQSKVDSVRAKLFSALRSVYQTRDSLRILIRYRRSFIERLLADGEESAKATACDYEREADEKDKEYESTASALEGKRELTGDDAMRLRQHWKKLVRMFHPDLHQHDPAKRSTYEKITQAINNARDRGDLEAMESIAKDPQGFIFRQGWTSVSFEADAGLIELRSLYQHLQIKVLEMIELLDSLKSSGELKIFEQIEVDDHALEGIIHAQRETLQLEIAELYLKAERLAKEVQELTGEVPF